MDVMASALKHGVTEAAIAHVLAHPMRYVEYEYDGEERLLIIGADETGRLLEVVAVPPDGPNRVIHANDLQPKFYAYLGAQL